MRSAVTNLHFELDCALYLISITRCKHICIVSLSSPLPWSVKDNISLQKASIWLCPREQNDLKCAFKKCLLIILIVWPPVSHRLITEPRIWTFFRLNLTKWIIPLQTILHALHISSWETTCSVCIMLY